MADLVDRLLDRVTKGGAWPPQSERATWSSILAWRAFAESDRETLKKVAGWTSDTREYRVDPLPERIAEAWADYLFGEELDVTPDSENDADLLDGIVAANDLTDEVRAAERDYVVPEGEAWWRAHVDPEVSDRPLIEWHSRASIAPLFIGGRLMAAAVITVLEGPAHGKAGANAIYRHFEIHTEGAVEHVLFRGTSDRIGGTVPLDSHPETEELATVLGVAGTTDRAVWEHGLPLMLVGRVINRRARDPRLGRSEFAGIRDYLLDLNEATTIAAENARLTAKKRVVIPASSATPAGGGELVDRGDGSFTPAAASTFDAGEDVLIADTLNEELGRESTPPFKVLEYSFDATALIAHKRELVEAALTRIGLSPQVVGIVTGNEGYAVSGTAHRLRLIPTDKAAKGKARPWDNELPRALFAAMLLDQLSEADGGLGNAYATLEPPTVKRATVLPSDPVEEAQVEQALVGAGVRSVETSVRAQHPEWTDPLVAEEVDRIKADKSAGAIGAAAGGFGV